jgi:hypothetical protein
MATGWRENQRLDVTPEGKVVEDDSSQDICEDSTSVFVDREEEGPTWIQGETRNILSVGKRKGRRLGAGSALAWQQFERANTRLLHQVEH